MTRSRTPPTVDAALSAYWQQAAGARRGFELGLLLGVASSSSSNDALLTAMPVPPESEDGDVRGFEDVSADWAQEFAKQVDRLLPGGVSVVGLYVLSAAPARAALDQAALYLRAVADALRVPEAFAALVGEESASAARYVVHVCANSGKTSARVVSDVLEASKASAAPVELKSGGAALALRRFSTVVAVNEAVIFRKEAVLSRSSSAADGGEGVVERVVAALQPQLEPLAARVFLASAVCSRRRPVGPDESESERVQLLLPAAVASRATEAAAGDQVSTAETLRGSFRGAISCVVFIPRDEPSALQAAVAALKRDFLKSLLLRAELVAERWADADADTADSPLSVTDGGGVLPFPRRASLRWSSSLGVCTHFPALLHVFRDEHELAAQSALEILGSRDAEEAASTLAFLESEASPPRQQQQEKGKRSNTSSKAAASSASAVATATASSNNSALFIAAAVLLALLAIVAQRVLL